MVALRYLLGSFLCASFANAFFFDFSGQHQQQHQQAPVSYEDQFLDNECDGFLCDITLECVKSSSECSCPYPKSQLKCPLSKGQYVCISKPATHDAYLNSLYDDPVRGPKQNVKGMRDCGWVHEMYKEIK